MGVSGRSRFPAPPERAPLLYRDLFGVRDTALRLQSLGQGIAAIVGSVRELLMDVEILAEAKRWARARFILATADEELGKAHLLVDVARLDVKHENALRKLSAGFYDHVTKYCYMRAWRFRETVAPPYGIRLGHFFACDSIKWWPGDGEGVPDLPHDTAFSRDANLYVDYSDWTLGEWIAPDERASALDFGSEALGREILGLDDKRVSTREHLAAFEQLLTKGALELTALQAFHGVWRSRYVRASTPDADVEVLHGRTAAAVAPTSSCSVDEVLNSPLCLWPCYDFVAEPKLIW
jgi:AbiV family abortive infection protein